MISSVKITDLINICKTNNKLFITQCSLYRLKTWLRNTISENRLNDLTIFYIRYTYLLHAYLLITKYYVV